MTLDKYTTERQSPGLSVEVKDLESDLNVCDCADTVPVQITPWSKPHLKFVTLGRCHIEYIKELQQPFLLPVSFKINHEGKEINLIFQNL
jgi:hypothetical protein